MGVVVTHEQYQVRGKAIVLVHGPDDNYSHITSIEDPRLRHTVLVACRASYQHGYRAALENVQQILNPQSVGSR